MQFRMPIKGVKAGLWSKKFYNWAILNSPLLACGFGELAIIRFVELNSKERTPAFFESALYFLI